MNIDEHWTDLKNIIISHRIHGAGIYANIWGIFMVNVTIIYIYIYIAAHGLYTYAW